MPSWSEMMFQESQSTIMILVNSFHDYVMFVLIIVIAMAVFVVLDLTIAKTSLNGLVESQSLEVWWTVIPGLLLITIAYPSLNLLYLMDEVEAPSLTVDAMGHQWFWEYNYPEFNKVMFESYMITDVTSSQARLMEVDNRVVLPAQNLIRLLVSSVDVLHAWAMPSLGVKADAVPGRVNQLGLESYSSTLSYGQCSEICGVNHSFMPIVLEFIPSGYFVKWIKEWT